MLTIKSCGYSVEGQGFSNSLTITTADRVTHHIHDHGHHFLRLERFVTGNLASVNAEEVIILDANCVYGPKVVYVENAAGKTVQKFDTDVPFTPKQPVLAAVPGFEYYNGDAA